MKDCTCTNGIAYHMSDGNHIYCDKCEQGKTLAAKVEESKSDVPFSIILTQADDMLSFKNNSSDQVRVNVTKSGRYRVANTTYYQDWDFEVGDMIVLAPGAGYERLDEPRS